MLTCPNCSKQLPDNARFCDACGTKIPETIFCPQCGEKTSRDGAFCEQCGKPLAESPAPEEKASSAESPAAETASPAVEAGAPAHKTNAAVAVQDAAPASPPKEKKPFPKKAFLFGGIALVAVAAIIVLAMTLFGGGKKDNFALYLQDGDIVYTDFKKDGATEITSRLVSNDDEVAYYGNHIRFFTAVTKDGSKIFYPEKADMAESEGVTLYYRPLRSTKMEAVKVDSGITNYAVNESGTAIVYTKGTYYEDTAYTLYFSDFKERVKIAGDVSSDFHVSGDCKKAVYIKTDDNCYYWTAGQDPVKISSDVSFICHVSEDMSVVYYIKNDDTLYRYTVKTDESEKIASDVSFAQVCETGEVYFTRYKLEEVSLYDYIKDDLLESDAAITYPDPPVYPVMPAYPDWYDYDFEDDYYAAVDQYYIELDAFWDEVDRIDIEYYGARDRYDEKEYRDALRERLKTHSYSLDNLSLYYYDGSTETLIAEHIQDYKLSGHGPVLFLNVFQQPEEPVMTLSDLGSYYEYDMYNNYYNFEYLDDIGYEITRALRKSRKSFMAVGSSLTDIEYDVYLDLAQFLPDGTTAYFIDFSSRGDLYKVSLANGQPSEPVLVDSDVDLYSVRLMGDRLIYYKDVDDDVGDLYVDEARTGTDAQVGVYPMFSGDAVLYITDDGALMISENGSSTRLSDDVEDFYVTPAGDVVFLKDFSENIQTGTLYHYRKAKRQKLAGDVSGLVTPYDLDIYGMKAFSYGW